MKQIAIILAIFVLGVKSFAQMVDDFPKNTNVIILNYKTQTAVLYDSIKTDLIDSGLLVNEELSDNRTLITEFMPSTKESTYVYCLSFKFIDKQIKIRGYYRGTQSTATDFTDLMKKRVSKRSLDPFKTMWDGLVMAAKTVYERHPGEIGWYNETE